MRRLRFTVLLTFVVPVLVNVVTAAEPPDSVVPRVEMPEQIHRLLADSIRSFAFSVNRRNEYVKRNILALKQMRALQWPDLDHVKGMRLYSAKDPQRHVSAWCVPSDGDTLTVLLPDFSERRVRRDQFSRIEPGGFDETLTALLQHLDQRDPESARPWDFTFVEDFGRGGLPYRGGVFLLHQAYVAAYFDRAEQAERLVHHALRQQPLSLEQTYNEAAWQSFARGVQLLSGNASRKDVLEQWKQTLSQYGESRYGEQVQDLVSQLEKQVREDEQLAAAEVDEPENLPLDQRIEYHLARLVDVRGQQISQPGYCRTYGLGEQTVHSDALITIGRPAVPGLIARLDDRRLTRSIGFWRNFAPSRTVLRVQDVAVQCIEAILDIRFYRRSSTSSYLSSESEAVRRGVIDDIKSWWAEQGDKPPVEGHLARLDHGSYHERIQTLQKVEALDASRVESVAVLKRWAVEAAYDHVPLIAEALAARDDFSLLPAIRLMLDDERRVPNQCIWYLLRHGDESDFRKLRRAARSEIESGAKLGSTRIWGAVASGVEGSKRPLAVPILVDLLDRREITGSRYISQELGSRGFSCADSCMGALIRLTGHNEGYERGDPDEQRYAAIDRWIEWWQREGKQAYLQQHPDVGRVYEDEPSPQSVVQPIDESALTEIGEVGLFWRPAVFDAQRQIWFGLYDHRVDIEATKREVEAAFAGDTRVIRGAELICFDAHGRLWLIPRQNIRLLLGYDPRRQQWIERPALSDPERFGFDPREKNTTAYGFTGPAFEAGDGTLLIGDRIGVHVLRGGDWSYQLLYESQLQAEFPPDRIKSFNLPEFSQGPNSTVYVWSVGGRYGWSGTVGFWTFDGARWKNIDQFGNPDKVIPGEGAAVWLLCDGQLSKVEGDQVLTGEEAQGALRPNLRFQRAAQIAHDSGTGVRYLLLRDVTVLKPFEKTSYRVVALGPHGQAVDLGREASRIIAALSSHRVVIGPGGWLFGRDGDSLSAISPDGRQCRRLTDDPRVSNLSVQASDGLRFVYGTGGGKAWRLEFVP